MYNIFMALLQYYCSSTCAHSTPLHPNRSHSTPVRDPLQQGDIELARDVHLTAGHSEGTVPAVATCLYSNG